EAYGPWLFLTSPLTLHGKLRVAVNLDQKFQALIRAQQGITPLHICVHLTLQAHEHARDRTFRTRSDPVEIRCCCHGQTPSRKCRSRQPMRRRTARARGPSAPEAGYSLVHDEDHEPPLGV